VNKETIENYLYNFIYYEEAVRKLRGEEQGLIRVKYFERKREEKLYQACFLSNREYFSAQSRVLEKTLRFI